MIVSALVLFVFGTLVSAGPFIPPAPTEIIISKNRHASSDLITEYYPSRGKSPFINNFVQKGTNVFFKPEFMLSAAQMPPPVQAMIATIEKDDCKTVHPIGPLPMMIEKPGRILEDEFVFPPAIKEMIEINPIPITRPIPLPKLPLVIEEPCEIQQVIIPEAPFMVEIEKAKTPAVIPPAPVLPPLRLPQIPLMVEEVPLVPELVRVPEILPELPIAVPCDTVEIVEKHIQPKVIPEAPLLPPLAPLPAPVIIEAPVNMFIEQEVIRRPTVIPSAPVLPPLVHKVPLVAPCDTVEVIEKHPHPFAIEAPILPPLAPLPLPTPVIVDDSARVEIERKLVKPVVLPPAPLLPTLVMPKAPIVVERPGKVVVEPCEPANEIIVERRPIVPRPVAISELSLPRPVVMAPSPSFIVENSPLSFPVSCAQDVVVERILPNMRKELRPKNIKTLVPTYLQ